MDKEALLFTFPGRITGRVYDILDHGVVEQNPDTVELHLINLDRSGKPSSHCPFIPVVLPYNLAEVGREFKIGDIAAFSGEIYSIAGEDEEGNHTRTQWLDANSVYIDAVTPPALNDTKYNIIIPENNENSNTH